MNDHVRSMLGPYELIERFPIGGMGIVYRAVHQRTGAVVALKTVRDFEPDLLEGVRREIQALSHLNHPGVVRILDTSLDDLTPWFAMEFVEGRTLAAVKHDIWETRSSQIREAPTLVDAVAPVARAEAATSPPTSAATPRAAAASGKLDEVLRLVRQLSIVLAYVHGQGLTHADLKPSNVVVRADGTPVLIDFGLATALLGTAGRERLHNAKLGAGTVAFMAPEVLRREMPDARADLYALGCILYELVTGELPSDPPLPPSAVVTEVPKQLDELIIRLLARRPEDRIGHARDVVEALDALLRARGVDLSGRADWSAATLDTNAPVYLYRSRLVGRQDVLGTLVARLQSARQGQGGLVLLTGESGSGKTFLAAELGREAARLKMRVVNGECEPVGVAEARKDERNVALHPFRQLLRAVADRCIQQGEGATQRILDGRARTLARYHAPLAALPGAQADAAGAGDEPLGEAARSRAIGALADTVAAFAADEPLLLLLDDVHWADALSLDFLRYLVPSFFVGTPLLVVATYRSEEAGPRLDALVGETKAQLVSLQRLGDDAVGRQAANMLAVPETSKGLAEFLARECNGNPFFVAEYLRAAVEGGFIQRSAGRWIVSATGQSLDGALTLPRSLHDLISRRLGGLSPSAGQLARVCAVLGRDVDARFLAELTGQSADDMAFALGELLRRQVLEQAVPARYRFVHDKLREIAYQEADGAELRRLHGQAGLLIERRGESPDTYPALARHFRLAGDPVKALRYYRLAGEQAWLAGAFQDAREHLSRVLELSPPRTADPVDPDLRLNEARTRRWLGESLFHLGDIDQAIVQYDDALDWLGQRRLPKSMKGWRLKLTREIAGQIAHRWAPFGMLDEPDHARRAMAAEAAAIAERLSWAYVFRFRMTEMLASIFLGANLADRAGAAPCQAVAHAALGSFIGHLRLRRVAKGYFARAQAAVEKTKDLSVSLRVSKSECILHLNQGEWASVRKIGTAALQLGRSLGTTHDGEALSQTLSTAAMLTGDFSEAQELAHELAEQSGQLGHRIQAWWGTLTVAACALRQGSFARVRDLLVPVEKGCREYQDIVTRLESLALMAMAALRAGDQEEALKLADDARQAAIESGSGSVFGFSYHWLLPELYAAVARARGGRDPQLIRRFEEARRLGTQFAWMCRVARPFSLVHRGRSFELAGKPSEARRAFRDSANAAARLEMPFDEALAHLAVAQSAGVSEPERRERAGKAVAIFDRLGCAWYLHEAHQNERGKAA